MPKIASNIFFYDDAFAVIGRPLVQGCLQASRFGGVSTRSGRYDSEEC